MDFPLCPSVWQPPTDRSSTAETIAYALKKECQRISLYDWCDSWDITTDEFDEFLALAVGNAEEEESDG
jgi:hypothetical protein